MEIFYRVSQYFQPGSNIPTAQYRICFINRANQIKEPNKNDIYMQFFSILNIIIFLKKMGKSYNPPICRNCNIKHESKQEKQRCTNIHRKIKKEDNEKKQNLVASTRNETFIENLEEFEE